MLVDLFAGLNRYAVSLLYIVYEIIIETRSPKWITCKNLREKWKYFEDGTVHALLAFKCQAINVWAHLQYIYKRYTVISTRSVDGSSVGGVRRTPRNSLGFVELVCVVVKEWITTILWILLRSNGYVIIFIEELCNYRRGKVRVKEHLCRKARLYVVELSRFELHMIR